MPDLLLLAAVGGGISLLRAALTWARRHPAHPCPVCRAATRRPVCPPCARLGRVAAAQDLDLAFNAGLYAARLAGCQGAALRAAIGARLVAVQAGRAEAAARRGMR